eukprot:4849465-Amphidinium_carterae.1
MTRLPLRVFRSSVTECSGFSNRGRLSSRGEVLGFAGHHGLGLGARRWPAPWHCRRKAGWSCQACERPVVRLRHSTLWRHKGVNLWRR